LTGHTDTLARISASPTGRDCSLDDLAPGETVTLRQTIAINPVVGSSLALDVEVWTDTVDPRLPNRQTLDIPIGPSADILVTQEADEDTNCELLCPDGGPCPSRPNLVPECSLRSALERAAIWPGEQRILLGDGVFELDRNSSAGGWTVNDEVQLLGLGAGRTRLSGARTDRVITMENPANLVLEDLSIVDGLTDSSGGGIATFSDGELILRRVHVQGNGSQGAGGGILNFRGRLELWDSTVSGNESNNSGGGIFSDGPTRIVNSTVSGNFAAGEGGGILISRSGSLSLESSTVTANSTGPAPGSLIRQSTGVRILTENLIENPSTIYQSVISGNGSLDNDVPDCDLPRTDALTSLGFNYVEESCLDTLASGDQTGQTPQLSGLGDQGGPTPTHVPLAGSPLLDAGDPQCAGTDQRGIARPQDGDGDRAARCDIGAVEFQLPWIFSDRFERGD